jgi:hypothetical protein
VERSDLFFMLQRPHVGDDLNVGKRESQLSYEGPHPSSWNRGRSQDGRRIWNIFFPSDCLTEPVGADPPFDTVTEPPSSFHWEESEDWAVWVLDHGLPRLPGCIGDDDAVPVSYWAGPDCGAVLFRSFAAEDEHGARDVDDTVVPFRRTTEGWVGVGGDAGGAGPLADPLSPLPVASTYAAFGGGSQVNGIMSMNGVVGTAAAWIEATDRNGVTRRRVEAPVSVIVVCFDVDHRVTLRILDTADRPLLEHTVEPGYR